MQTVLIWTRVPVYISHDGNHDTIILLTFASPKIKIIRRSLQQRLILPEKMSAAAQS